MCKIEYSKEREKNVAAFFEWEWNILNGIQVHLRCGFLDVLLTFVTRLGNFGAFWITLGMLLLFSRKYRAAGLTLLSALAVGTLVGNVVVKPLVARARPSWIAQEVQLLIANPRDYSFPSGHSLSSFAAATVLAFRDRRFAVPTFALATLIAFSRLYLYVHFPSDVLVGAVLGFLAGYAAHRFLAPRFETLLAGGKKGDKSHGEGESEKTEGKE